VFKDCGTRALQENFSEKAAAGRRPGRRKNEDEIRNFTAKEEYYKICNVRERKSY
jgi:hypothetical protein